MVMLGNDINEANICVVVIWKYIFFLINEKINKSVNEIMMRVFLRVFTGRLCHVFNLFFFTDAI